MNCPVCSSCELTVVELELPTFSTLDYELIGEQAVFARCARCSTILNVVGDTLDSRIQDEFKQRSFAFSDQTIQTFNAPGKDHPVTRAVVQADFLIKLVDRVCPSILDIGCFDGTLLREIRKQLPEADLHGFDVNEYLAELLPTDSDIRFWLGELSGIKGKFDLVCLSHSMMYIKDVRSLMERIEALLAYQGKVFVQVPNIVINPCQLLMGDQYYYYTISNLINVFRQSCFELTPVPLAPFTREIVAIATRSTSPAETKFRVDGDGIESMAELARRGNSIRSIDLPNGVSVLGTAANAALVDAMRGDRVKYFIDENPLRVGKLFRGKIVRHPRELTKEDIVVLPYGAAGSDIKVRFEASFNGQYLVV